MVFSDEKEIVVNNLLLSVKNSIDQYEQAAAISDDSQLTVLFEELASDRREMANVIEGILKTSGYLPADPDPDRQSLVELTTRIRAAFSSNDRIFLLEKTEELENNIKIHLQEARGLDWPEPVRQVFAALEARVNAKEKSVQAIRSDS